MSEVTDERDAAAGDVPPDGPDTQGEGSSLLRLALIAVLTVALGMWASLSTLAVIAALVFMIFMHELGHYLTAKAAGMKVTEFFIGFGPRLWSFTRGETEYGVKAIPAGAYVRIIGMSNLEEVDAAEEGRTYRQQPYWRRMSVALAGSAMHFLMAFLLIYLIFVGFGTPAYDSDRWTVGAISRMEDTGSSPALEAGIELGDRIVSVDGRSFETFTALAEYVRERPGEDVTIVVLRDGERVTLETTLAEQRPEGDEVGFLGIGPSYERVRANPVTAVWDSATTTVETMWLSLEGLGAFFSPDGLSGYLDTLAEPSAAPEPGEIEGEGRLLSPVGAVRIANQAAAEGVAQVLSFLFLINVFVGVFNLVPLLPLDGGHVAIATYEKLRSLRTGRRYFADVGKLLPLTYAVVLVLVLVGVTALYLDITNPIGNPFEPSP